MLVTQEDPFHIPRLISALLAERGDDVVAVMILPGEISRGNVGRYVRFLGVKEFSRHASSYLCSKALDRAFPKGRGRHFYSVKAVARRHGIAVLEPGNVNSVESVAALEGCDVELVISIAAPQIFRRRVLSVPRYGCINLHNGLLPRYQGLLPSFWALANGEGSTGSTVHYMSEEIDRGDVLLQEEVPILPTDTFHSLVERTKVDIGPKLLLEAITRIEEGRAEPVEVDWAQSSYFSFPDDEAVRRFRQARRRFR